MADMAWAAAGLLLLLPADLKLESSEPLEDFTRGVEEPERGVACSWRGSDGRTLTLQWWAANTPPRPGPPITVKDRWGATFAAERVGVVQPHATAHHPKGTLLTSRRIEPHGAFVHLAAEGLPRDVFDAILAKARVGRRSTAKTLQCTPIKPGSDAP